MRNERIQHLRRGIQEAIYGAWIKELTEHGANEVTAHRQAEMASKARMEVIDAAMTMMGWLPVDARELPSVPIQESEDYLLRRVLSLKPSALV